MQASFASRGAIGSVTALFAGALSAALFAASLMHADSVFVYLGYASSLPLFVGFMPLLLVSLGIGSMACLEACFIGSAGLYLLQPHMDCWTFLALISFPIAVLAFLTLPRKAHGLTKAPRLSDSNLLAVISIYPCAIFVATFFLGTREPGGIAALTAPSAA